MVDSSKKSKNLSERKSKERVEDTETSSSSPSSSDDESAKRRRSPGHRQRSDDKELRTEKESRREKRRKAGRDGKKRKVDEDDESRSGSLNNEGDMEHGDTDRVFLLPSNVRPTLEVVGPLIHARVEPGEQQVDRPAPPNGVQSVAVDAEAGPLMHENNTLRPCPEDDATAPRRRVIGPEMPSAELLAAAAKLTDAQAEVREAELEEENETFIGLPPPALVIRAASANEAERFEEMDTPPISIPTSTPMLTPFAAALSTPLSKSIGSMGEPLDGCESLKMWNDLTEISDYDASDPMCIDSDCDNPFGCHHEKHDISELKAHLNDVTIHEREQSQMDLGRVMMTHKMKGVKGEEIDSLAVAQYNIEYNEEKIRMAIVRMIVIDKLSFKIVEKEGFKNLIHELEPRFKMPSKYTVMKDCMEAYLLERDRLKANFKFNNYRICFTIQCSTSILDINYVSVTAHFIDRNWKLHKRTLSFHSVLDHDGVTIGKELEDCMRDWKIDKILTITVNNVSSYDVAIEQVKRRQLQVDTLTPGKIICDHDFLQVSCCAHILNLIVTEGLEVVDDSIEKIRNMIKYVKSAPQGLDTFKKCVEQQKIQDSNFLTLDVPTRWNTTYMMLDAAEKYQRAFELMMEDDEQFRMFLCEDENGRRGLGPPTSDDWEHIRHFVKFLKFFYEVTLQMCGSEKITSNVYFEGLAEIHEYLFKYSGNGDIILENLALRMKTKYDMYWGDLMKMNRFLFVATVLDPRFKMAFFEFWFERVLGTEKGHEMIGIVRATIDRLFEEYNNIQSMDDSVSSIASNGDSDDNGISHHLGKWFDEFRAAKNLSNKKSELERYFMEDFEEITPSFDILNWWKVNSTKFPILACIARDVLAIPITVVSPESVFSSGGHVLDAFQSSLAPRMLEGLICAQNWLSSELIDKDRQSFLDLTEDPESYRLDAEISTLVKKIEQEF